MKKIGRILYLFVEDVIYGAAFLAGAVTMLFKIIFKKKET